MPNYSKVLEHKHQISMRLLFQRFSLMVVMKKFFRC